MSNLFQMFGGPGSGPAEGNQNAAKGSADQASSATRDANKATNNAMTKEEVVASFENPDLKTIHRAGDSDEMGVKSFSSWSEDKDTAKAYLDNPGFGGKTLREEKYPLKNVIDADTTDRRGMEALAQKLGFPQDTGDEWFDNGWKYPWEESKKVKEALKNSGADAIRYIDDFPEGAKTIVPLKDFNSKEATTKEDHNKAATLHEKAAELHSKAADDLEGDIKGHATERASHLASAQKILNNTKSPETQVDIEENSKKMKEVSGHIDAANNHLKEQEKSIRKFNSHLNKQQNHLNQASFHSTESRNMGLSGDN